MSGRCGARNTSDCGSAGTTLAVQRLDGVLDRLPESAHPHRHVREEGDGMFAILVKFSLKDYGIWRQKFDDPSRVTVVFQTADLAKGKAHLNDPEIKKKQADSGFLAPPEMFAGELL
jgi:hypothetical protein